MRNRFIPITHLWVPVNNLIEVPRLLQMISVYLLLKKFTKPWTPCFKNPYIRPAVSSTQRDCVWPAKLYCSKASIQFCLLVPHIEWCSHHPLTICMSLWYGPYNHLTEEEKNSSLIFRWFYKTCWQKLDFCSSTSPTEKVLEIQWWRAILPVRKSCKEYVCYLLHLE